MKRTTRLFQNRINNIAAFTLAEALVAILIMLMVSSIMVAGIPAARRAYENVVIVSNAELVMSTTISALRNELGLATNVAVGEDNKTITYYSQSNDSLSKISLDADNNNKYPNGTIMLQVNAGSSNNEFGLPVDLKGGDIVPLISRKTSDEKLYATYEEVNIENGVITFTDLVVKDDKGRILAPQGRTSNETSIRLIAN